jgi:hypothetical protein
VDIGLDVNIDDVVNLNPKLSRVGDNKYVLKESFNDEIGICTLAYEIDIEFGADGKTNVSLGEATLLDRNSVLLTRD